MSFHAAEIGRQSVTAFECLALDLKSKQMPPVGRTHPTRRTAEYTRRCHT